MIFLAFFFPLAIYLVVLGLLNRRRHPLVVSGVWDGMGLVFGVSGFLLFAGPAVFSALSERWRLFWLLGRGNVALAGPNDAWPFWVFLSVLYFVLVVGGTAYYFWRQRHLTAIYNAEAAQVEEVITDICERLNLNPVRSGGLFLFGLSLGLSAERRGSQSEGLQAPHYLPAPLRAVPSTLSSSAEEGRTDAIVREQSAILEVDDFPLMRHVTLRWDPVDSPLRRVMEAELRHHLAETPSEDNFLSGWLLTLGSLLMSFEFAGAFVVIFLRLYGR